MRIKKGIEATAQAYAQMDHYSHRVVIGGWSAIAWEEVSKDWDYYSKAWHRQYGPKIYVLGRYVKFTSPSGKKTKTVSLDSWQGNWQLKALVEAGLVKPRKGQMKIRLNQAFDIKSIGKKMGYQFYARLLKGDLLDYCVVSPLGMTFHGSSPIACIKGLKLKQAQIEARKVAFIDMPFLLQLGFCREGIVEFCSDFGFSVKDQVTPDEVYQKVRLDPRAATPYLNELKLLAKTVGYFVPEINTI
jgi:hypothetical protein